MFLLLLCYNDKFQQNQTLKIYINVCVLSIRLQAPARNMNQKNKKKNQCGRIHMDGLAASIDKLVSKFILQTASRKKTSEKNIFTQAKPGRAQATNSSAIP